MSCFVLLVPGIELRTLCLRGTTELKIPRPEFLSSNSQTLGPLKSAPFPDGRKNLSTILFRSSHSWPLPGKGLHTLLSSSALSIQKWESTRNNFYYHSVEKEKIINPSLMGKFFG